MSKLTHQRLDRWLSTFKAPIVRPRRIVIGHGPRPEYRSYSYLETDKQRPDYDWVYALPSINKQSFAHEMGHVFDERLFRPEHRVWVTKFLKITTPWFWSDMPIGPLDDYTGPDAGIEQFADAYAIVALDLPWMPRIKRVRLRRFLNTVAKEG